MATPAIIAAKHPLEDPTSPPRKRFKTSELPLNSAQRSSIDGLLNTIKKKGDYDALRKQVWSQFIESEEKAAFTRSLHELAEAEIDRDPSLLSRDRGKAATLMQGAVDRSDIYKNVEKILDGLIARNIHHIIKAGRDIRRAEVGEDVAAKEQKRGSRTDEGYAEEVAIKRQERARIRKQEEARKRREDQKEALRLEEAQKLKELEQLRSQEEKRKEREAIRASRDLARKKPRDVPREEPVSNPPDQPLESPITAVPPIDEKALEEIALAELINDAREAAAKNAPKVERDRSESPHSKPHISPPKGPAAMRARDPTKPKIGFSSTPAYHGSPIAPPPPSVPSRSRSPYRASSSRHDRSRSASRTGHRSDSIRDDEHRREVESEATAALKAQMRDRRASEATAYKARDEEEYYDRRHSVATERDSTRDRDRDERRSSRYDYDQDYKDSRDSRIRDRSRERERHRQSDRTYTRPPREEAPEHIDRYVPGGAVPRERRDRDVSDRDRETRERDSTGQDTKREPRRDRGSYYDTERERQYFKKDSDGSRSEYRDKDRGSDRTRDRDRDHGYRGRDRRDDRDHSYRERDRRDDRYTVRPRTDEPPEHIDRYVPGK